MLSKVYELACLLETALLPETVQKKERGKIRYVIGHVIVVRVQVEYTFSRGSGFLAASWQVRSLRQ